MAPIEVYLENADKLAQDTVNIWGTHALVGDTECIKPEFMAVFEKAAAYKSAKSTAEAYRLVEDLKRTDDGSAQAEEIVAKRAFVDAYIDFWIKNSPEKR